MVERAAQYHGRVAQIGSLLLLCWLCAAGVARAQAGAQPGSAGSDTQVSDVSQDDEEGRGFFIAGRAAFVAGHYDEALQRFQHSYQKSGRPELLYNIGAAAERAGKYRVAVAAYEEFLAKLPDSEHPEVKERLAELRERAEAEPPAAVAPPIASHSEPTRVDPATRDGHPLLAPALLLAGSGALLVSGATLLVLGRQAHNRVEDAPDGADWSTYSDDADRAPLFSNLGISLLSVGAVGALVSAFWLPRALGKRSLTVTAGVLSVACAGRF